jgi:iron complex outermembrane receptor protein
MHTAAKRQHEIADSPSFTHVPEGNIMTHRKKILTASILASLCVAALAQAQQASTTAAPATLQAADGGPAPAAMLAQNDSANSANGSDESRRKLDVQKLAPVTVTGIRNSEALSLEIKKDASTHIEVVTSEDIGKLPAKNVADTLQRLPGINIASASASEGGFDENDRVSLRGTNPSLTQTLINGHNVGTGDWFVLSQVQTVGRSVSYTLLPAEIVSQVVVKKTASAKDVEGGTAGSVNIVTRKPLEFSKPVTAEVSLGGVYASLPSDTKPQASGMFNWKNDEGTAGLLLQAFYEERSLQRRGQEVVGGYSQIAATDAIAVAHPDLAGVYYPNLLGAVLFTQTRKRTGGVVDFQIKPTENFWLDFSGFSSKLEADNYNRNYMMWGSHGFVPNGDGLQAGYTIDHGVLTSANFAAVPGSNTAYGVYDQISRPGAGSSTNYLTVEANWRASERLSFNAQAGSSHGKGESPRQDVLELGTAVGGGAQWNMHGIGSPIDWNLGGDNSSPSGIQPSAGWIFGEGNIHVKDDENWAQADGTLDFFNGVVQSLDFGMRYADHTRENLTSIAQGPKGDWQNLANYPTSWSNYPGGFCSDVGSTCPDNIWFYSPRDLAAFDAQFANRDPIARFYFNDIYSVNEKSSAAYAQVNFAGENWAGNVGLRYVSTRENISYSSTSPQEAVVDGPITGSAFGNYFWNTYKHDYSEVLPSANLKFDISDDLVGRLAASKTMTRPDYSAMAGFVSLDDLTHTGNGGNPQLRPIVSTNFDASLEWYFAPRGLLSAGFYNMDMKDYVNFSNQTRTYVDAQASQTSGQTVTADYLVSVPANVGAKIHGFEFNYIQPIGEHFGVNANYTYADGEAKGGGPLSGASKNTWNVGGFFENERFNARLSYTYRSSFYAGVSRTDAYFQKGIGNLAGSMNYSFNEHLALSFDAMNLNNAKLKYYTQSAALGQVPYAFYTNGRQYYLTLRYKF